MAETTQSARRAELPGAEFIFGRTPEMGAIRTKIERALLDDLPVLIEGESGTGKEVIGRFLHNYSRRRGEAFVKVNCGAVPARVLEGVMFGNEEKSGSHMRQTGNGSIAMAAGGTLFLDEIAELDATLQRKLVRTLETGPRGRQEGREERAVNARFVGASSRDLRAAAQGDGVRGELLNGFAHHVRLSPLRERKQDIPQLCEYLVEKFARNFGRPVPGLSPSVLNAFQQWNWPGNIRELENWIARMVIFGTEEAIGLEFKRQLDAWGGLSVRHHRATSMPGVQVRRRRSHS